MRDRAVSNRGSTPWLQDPDVTLYHGDVLATLRELPAESVDCVVTSPPYWGLRDYGTGEWEGGDAECDHRNYPGAATGNKGAVTSTPMQGDCTRCGATRIDQQLGLEPTPEQYVERMVEVFREVRRVLAAHGTVWLNLGDSYAGGGGGNYAKESKSVKGRDGVHLTNVRNRDDWLENAGLKAKDLVGIPWRVAFALQADGWYLRSDIIWAKPNPMPESVTDRPTKAHEYVFLLSKQPRYFFDQEAVREPAAWERWGDQTNPKHEGTNGAAGWIGSRSKDALTARSNKPGWSGNPNVHGEKGHPLPGAWTEAGGGRNIRSVWEIATQPYPEAHFATFPEELARRCIAAGCPEQVCRVCGKARERVVDVLRENRVDGGKGLNKDRADGGKACNADRSFTTLGFTDCGHTDYRPGIVLDPFMGSGTVAHVARKLGRHAIGIDLNESYLQLAAKRLQQQSLFAQEAVSGL